jgi:multidrug efflux pump subunit AcrA (membrane-fusion protein)
MRLLVLLLSVFCIAAPLLPAAESITVSNCVLLPDGDVQVPAQEDGVLKEILVREGQQVAAGEQLAQIDDILSRAQYDVARFKLEVAKKQATDKIDVMYAEAGFRYADSNVRRDRAANAKTPGTISQEVADEHWLEREKFRLSIDKAQKDLDVAALQQGVSEAELKAAKANVEHRQVLSPLDAEVVELKPQKGEWVKAGETVMRLVRLDLLRVQGMLDAKNYSPVQVRGRPVQVKVSLANGRHETFSGKVIYVKPLVEGGGYEVRAEVQNRKSGDTWILNPGLTAEMTIQLK